MDAARVVGGVIALIGAIFLLIALLLEIAGLLDLRWMIYLILAIVGLLGSVMGIGNKRIGGSLALVAGVVIIICALLYTWDIVTFTFLEPYSYLAFNHPIPYVTIEALFIVFGGIIMVAGGPD